MPPGGIFFPFAVSALARRGNIPAKAALHRYLSHLSAMPTKSNLNVDVLIVGAGPAGLMCANGLARAGVNVRIVDQR